MLRALAAGRTKGHPNGGSLVRAIDPARGGRGCRLPEWMRSSLLSLVAALALLLVPAALADTAPTVFGVSPNTVIVKLALNSGGLSLKTAPSLTSGGTTQVPLTVTDGRGTGTGWTLRLNTPGVTVTSITAACASNSTCTLPRASGPASGASLLAVAQGTGMGVMNLVVTVTGQPKGPLAFSVVPR